MLHQAFKDQGLAIIGVNIQEEAKAVRAFQEEFHLTFPLLLDRNGRVARIYGIWGHPTTVLIDRQGRMVGLVPGERDWASREARDLVRLLLGEEQ